MKAPASASARCSASPSRWAARSRSNPKVGKGATFTLYLPAQPGRPTASSAKANGNAGARARPDRRGRRAGRRPRRRACSTNSGFETTVVHSAKEALDRLANGERPKLIFSDIIMPGGISGIELARKVRNRFPELPILLTTGYSEDIGGSHGFAVLQKPYELSALADALQAVLRSPIAVS